MSTNTTPHSQIDFDFLRKVFAAMPQTDRNVNMRALGLADPRHAYDAFSHLYNEAGRPEGDAFVEWTDTLADESY